MSLAAAAAAVAEKQQLQQARRSSPQPQQHQLEAVRNRRRLLFTQAPVDCTEDTIRVWLSQFGAVEQLQMYSEGGAVLGSNCGLVTMSTSEAAAAVVAAVLGNMQLPPPLQKLSVNWVVQSDDHGALSADGNAMPSSLAANADRTVGTTWCFAWQAGPLVISTAWAASAGMRHAPFCISHEHARFWLTAL
jgi:hypothetical protein